jgi:hypothetical protein
MQTRKTFGNVALPAGALVHIGTDGLGGVTIRAANGLGFTDLCITPIQARDLIHLLVGAACAAGEEVEREKADAAMARQLGVKRNEIVIGAPARLPVGDPCPLNRCDHHGPGGCFDPGCRAAEGKVHP